MLPERLSLCFLWEGSLTYFVAIACWLLSVLFDFIDALRPLLPAKISASRCDKKRTAIKLIEKFAARKSSKHEEARFAFTSNFSKAQCAIRNAKTNKFVTDKSTLFEAPTNFHTQTSISQFAFDYEMEFCGCQEMPIIQSNKFYMKLFYAFLHKNLFSSHFLEIASSDFNILPQNANFSFPPHFRWYSFSI